MNFPGFEATSPRQQLDRIIGNGQKFAEVWNVQFSNQSIEERQEAHAGIAQFQTTGQNWQVQTKLVQYSWQDIIAKYEGQPYPASFFANFPKFLSVFLDGTVIRYFVAHWRYGVFTIFPLLLILLFFAASWLILGGLLSWMGIELVWLTLVASIFATMILIKWPGDKLYVNLSINDWGFARDLANGSNIAIKQRFDEFAQSLSEEIRNSTHDEIVIVGHSFGTIWAVQALARALEKNPDLLDQKPVSFLSLGSSLLKINLIPAARDMRKKSEIIFAHPRLLWDEYQTHIDLIAFCGTQPYQNLELKTVRADVNVHQVRYSRVMEKQRYRKMRKSFYRSHRQYIMYQDQRCGFDFFLRCFGPFSQKDLAQDNDIFQRIDEAGALHEMPASKNNSA